MISLDRKIPKDTGLTRKCTTTLISPMPKYILTFLLISCVASLTVFVLDQSNPSYVGFFLIHTALAESLEENSGVRETPDIMNNSLVNETIKLKSIDKQLDANPDNPDDTSDKDPISGKTPAENPREPVEKIIIDDTFNNTNIVNPRNNITDLLDCKTPYCDLMKPENISGQVTIRPMSPCTPTFASPEVFASSDYSFVKEWGSKGQDDGEFNTPQGIANTNSGDVIVGDTLNSRVQKFTADGVFITKWRPVVAEPWEFLPLRVAVDGCNINVLNRHGNPNLINKLDQNLSPISQWGSQDPRLGDPPYLNSAFGMAIDASSGAVYVVDYDKHIIKFTEDGAFILKWGQYGSGDGEFSAPVGIAVDSSGYVYVVDTDRSDVQKFTSNGNFVKKWGGYGTGNGKFIFPSSITTDLANNVYVSDFYAKRIQKFSSDGTFITSIPVSGRIVDISVDPSTGKVYATIYDDHVEVYAPNLISHKVPIIPKIQGPPN